MSDGDAIPWFRELYEAILAYRRHALFHDVLVPWIERARLAIADFGRFAKPVRYDRNDEAAQETIWNLYALSRVNDLLLVSFHRVPTHNKTARVAAHEYEEFYTQLGFTVMTPNRFSSFHHEIVKVLPSQDDEEPIGVLEYHWPGLMLGEMLFSRGGVEVIGGRKHVVQDIAEQSTLYFTFHRENRKTRNLSMGWGHNSQWRTSFRRDYQSRGNWIYHANGKNHLNAKPLEEEDRDGMTYEQRLELCKNRCFIVTDKPDDDDLWPYDDRFEEPAALD